MEVASAASGVYCSSESFPLLLQNSLTNASRDSLTVILCKYEHVCAYKRLRLDGPLCSGTLILLKEFSFYNMCHFAVCFFVGFIRETQFQRIISASNTHFMFYLK